MIKILILSLVSLSLFSAENIDRSILEKLSPISENLYLDLSSENLDSTNYMIRYIDGIPYIGTLCLTNSELTESFFTSLGILEGASIENYYSIKVPLDNFQSFCNSSETQYIQADEPVSIHLDSANVSSQFVDAGVDFTNSEFYESSGVVVGVIDFGFQFDHVMFQNQFGASRVKRAWLQSFASPNKPSNFNYGSEITPADYSRIPTDSQFDSHGSHVLGIAAGSRFPGTNIQGVASEADIILVAPNVYWDQLQTTSQTDIVDGIDYIFKEASRLGKPCVINLSLGTQIGPHDGSSIFDIMAAKIQNQSAFGRSLVTSAGNDGVYDITLKKDFKTNSDPLSSLFVINATNTQYIDVWGEEGKEICISVGININGSIVWSEEKYCTDKSGLYSGSLGQFNEGFTYTVSSSPRELINGKPRLFLSFDLRDNPTVGAIRIESDGLVYAWNCFVGGSRGDDFFSAGSPNYTSGIKGYQIGEIGGNNKDFITVASYDTRQRFRNINNATFSYDGNNGDISSFSSVGPNADDYLKPDISAPGSIILSAYNFYDQNQSINSQESNISLIDPLSGDYVGQQSGTSMSAPIVAGTVALMLRANPFLTQKQIISILAETAIEDSFTGIIPEEGSLTWGMGKINAYEAVRMAEEQASMINLFPDVKFGPNPFQERLLISFENTPTNKNHYMFVDRLGRIISEGKIPLVENEFKLEINTSGLAQGVYYFKIETDRFEESFPLIKLR